VVVLRGRNQAQRHGDGRRRWNASNVAQHVFDCLIRQDEHQRLPRMDEAPVKALAVDDETREALGQEASEITIGDQDVPLHYQVEILTTRKGLTCTPRSDENTLAHPVRPTS
jgi:hypothetical protein